MRILTLNLTYKWFDEIEAGRKTIEYREIKPYWEKRIWGQRHRITHVCFVRGYTGRFTHRRVTKIDKGPCPYDGWDEEYYRIHFEED